jgi:peptidoglycan/xylan/chitin deacetylase (PgdA/CDA1 family)
MALRAHVKKALEKTFAGSGLFALGARLHRRKVAILSYHNVVPDADPPLGDSSLHLPLSRLRAQLDVLVSRFHVVPLEDLVTGSAHPQTNVASGPGPGDGHRIRVAITFDDAYRGALELGLPEVTSRGLPATMFVCPGLLGGDGFWWDRLADPGSGVVPAPIRTHVLEALGGRQEEALAWARGEGMAIREMTRAYRPGTRAEVEEASASFSLGSHTWSHVNLATIPDGEARDELVRPLSWLRERGVEMPVTVSYPYGLSSKPVRDTAAGLGYAAGFLVEGGITAPGTVAESPFMIPRLNIPRGLSLEGFMARLSGVWPW